MKPLFSFNTGPDVKIDPTSVITEDCDLYGRLRLHETQISDGSLIHADSPSGITVCGIKGSRISGTFALSYCYINRATLLGTFCLDGVLLEEEVQLRGNVTARDVNIRTHAYVEDARLICPDGQESFDIPAGARVTGVWTRPPMTIQIPDFDFVTEARDGEVWIGCKKRRASYWLKRADKLAKKLNLATVQVDAILDAIRSIQASRTPPVEVLRYTQGEREVILENLENQHDRIIVTGPTGRQVFDFVNDRELASEQFHRLIGIIQKAV